MQVSQMRVLRAFYAQKQLLNRTSHKLLITPRQSFISCKYPHQNPKISLHFPSTPQRNFHSTHPRFLTEESSLPAVDGRDSFTDSVATVYDPVTGRLVTQKGTKSINNEEEELNPNNGDGGNPSWSNPAYEEALKEDRSYGGVAKANQKSRSGFKNWHGSKKKGKSKTNWVCSNCGYSDGQWWGQCRSCKHIGTMIEFSEVEVRGGSEKTSGFEVSEKLVRSWLPQQVGGDVPLRLADVNKGINQLTWRIPLPGLFGSEVARVLGGGLVPGSLVLVGGDPGVGKSTLLLQVAAIIAEGHEIGRPSPVIYVSGEESVEQIGNRADRMGIECDELFVYSNTDIEDILEKSQLLTPRALVIDSIQTVYLKGVVGSAGLINQVKECTSALLRFAKKTKIPVFLIGHVTKSGDIAGPRVLEHIVDTVLYMEGEKYSSYRLLRSLKNRFGTTDELGVFEMSQSGLQAVPNPSEIFLGEQHSDSEFLVGLAVAVIMDGSRTFVIEIQALCGVGTALSRQVNGIQAVRAEMIVAVLMKQGGLQLQATVSQGIFINVVSGVSLSETAGDLAVAAAICSSFLEFPIPKGIAFIGEIGLAGELRMVPRMEKRVNTVAKLGYSKCVVPKSAEKSLSDLDLGDMELLGCRNLKEVIDAVFVTG